MTVTEAPTRHSVLPRLPEARGPYSRSLLAFLLGDEDVLPAEVTDTDPYGEDLHLALYVCYELHYRGFAGIDDGLEWNPKLLAFRAELEGRFIDGLRRDVPVEGRRADEVLGGLLEEPVEGHGVSYELMSRGTIEQMREYVAHRSLYHLKEADPQSWVIPRMDGAVKSALVSIVHDEYGAGHPTRMHSQLFAELMVSLGLDSSYGAYLDQAPAVTLAEVNIMSLCGLHRAHRAAALGQFAVVEITSPPGSARISRALRRLGFPPDVSAFYDEHVEADAVHEQIARHRMVEPLLRDFPELEADFVFGALASIHLAERWQAHVLSAWRCGRSSLTAR